MAHNLDKRYEGLPMSADFELPIELEVKLRLREPGLLAKLDALVSLGLVSDAQVKVLCRTYLSEPLPEPQVIASPIAQKVEEDEREPKPLLPPVLSPVSPTNATTPAQLPPVLSPVAATKTPTPRQPQWIQSLMAELSVRWLLFLGVFMVVLSSGVLAATQWERFPPAGQYLVLFAYTMIFWGVSVWAQRQSQLRLTAQTLQWVSLLLLPVNFWTMDGFGLWESPLGWVAIAIATPILSFIAWQVLPLLLGDHRQSRRTLFPLAVYPVLCYLHWGWSFPGFATIAVYLGTIATALATVSPGTKKSGVNSKSPSPANLQPFKILLFSYALAILCGRAIFGIGVPIAQLGLAIAIGGWIILESDLTKEQPKIKGTIPPVVPQAGVDMLPREVTARPPQLFGYLGGWLMFAGWLVSVGEQPWQAIAISALALWWLGRRLPRFFHLFDTIAIFTITLQGYWLIRDIIPPAVRTSAIATGTQLAQAQQSPWALLGLTFFPYLLFVVWLTDWLYRRPPAQLQQGAKASARVGDAWALGFGVLLTLLSVPASSMRSLNLLASTLTLAVVTDRRLSWRTHGPTSARPIRPGEFGPFDFLVYLSHVSGLLALFSFVHWGFPRLPIFVWGLLLLALALAEWAVSLTLELKPDLALNLRISAWIESCWPVGLGLASLSYVFWVGNYDGLFYVDAAHWGIVWFATPLALTAIAHFSPDRRSLATGLSITTLILAQVLVWFTPATLLLGLGIGTVLMVVNTRLWQYTAVAAIAIGFGLSFVIHLLNMGVFGLPPISAEGWFVVSAIAVAALCVSYAVTRQRSSSLAQIYTKAYQGWAIGVGGLALAAISTHASNLYFGGFMESSVPILIATILIAGTLTYRMWLSPAAWTFYALGWAVELIAAETLIFFGRSLISLAIANLILGLVAALAGEWWIRRTGRPLRTSWKVIPLIYGVLGQALRWGTLTSWSGFTTLALVVIALTIGRRSREAKPLVYLALIGISVSAYEFLYYQISGLPDPAKFIAIATLGAAIVYNYRWLEPWLTDYLNLTKQEVEFFAHTHWGLSSFIWLSAVVVFSQSATAASSLGSIDLICVGTGVFLTNYALLQGRFPEFKEGEPDPRDRPEALQTAETWVYISMAESAAVGFYVFGYLPSNLQGMFIIWGGAIACVAAYFLDVFPWDRWGWPLRPWRLMARLLPGFAIITTGMRFLGDSTQEWSVSALIVAAFYVFLSYFHNQIRLTYWSAILLNWVILRGLLDAMVPEPIAYIIPMAAAVLYFAQVEPSLQPRDRKGIRHGIRVLAIASISLISLMTNHWLISGIINFLIAVAGLSLRIRAFLYVGTVTLLLNATYQLIILNALYPFLRWVIGLFVGIGCIWIAATVETRREQLVTLLQNWRVELESWD
ncbi:DUF2157 domain-containing protein [Laspinema olomoucense]|uniref:DUF2157 domain-containing protein n=1 Tax=Laspinema olomoucense TaxID=3231600 RepID=UPI0021BA6BD9|nr:DUF2157 domain-containing protein [Laspinema sp. D3c]MCT7993875.1 DUF2157 domain-containing protein [Laspinema sp. D3c]